MLREMWATTFHCIAALCGSDFPAAAQAAMVRPEQSYPPLPAAAYTYGVPMAPYAKRTAAPAAPLTLGTGPAGLADDDDEEPDEVAVVVRDARCCSSVSRARSLSIFAFWSAR